MYGDVVCAREPAAARHTRAAASIDRFIERVPSRSRLKAEQ
jgi:hypothetical protein